VRAATGCNGQATLELECTFGSATIYLQGAHVTSWLPAGGAEMLFVSQAARFAPGASIRGGVPVCFPQFAELGPLPMHGFAHLVPWEWRPSGNVGALLTLRDSDATRAVWPHRFVAELAVDLTPGALRLGLAVQNVGAAPWQWSGTLHTFLALAAGPVRAARPLRGPPRRLSHLRAVTPGSREVPRRVRRRAGPSPGRGPPSGGATGSPVN
jgi:glucose-6-phosphate 1-epimerase